MAKTLEELIKEFERIHKESRPENLAKPLQGTRMMIDRPEKEPVEVICYRKAEGKLPVYFNMHGGGFIGGDAVLMDSFCADLVSAPSNLRGEHQLSKGAGASFSLRSGGGL